MVVLMAKIMMIEGFARWSEKQFEACCVISMFLQSQGVEASARQSCLRRANSAGDCTCCSDMGRHPQSVHLSLVLSRVEFNRQRSNGRVLSPGPRLL